MTEEHTPAPQESRGIYGFVLFIMMNLVTLTYFVWTFMPTSWVKALPYEPPQAYWGLAIPVFFCTSLFFFAFCLYPAMHGLHEGDLDELSAFTDPHSLPANYFEEQRAKARATLNTKSVSKKVLNLKSRTWSSKGISSSFNDQGDIIPPRPPKKKRTRFCGDSFKPIPSVSDMDLDQVCQLLYLKK